MKKLAVILLSVLSINTLAGNQFDNEGDTWCYDGDLDIPWKSSRFDGHLAALEIGMNTYLNSDFETELPDAYSFLDLNTSNSWGVNISFAEVNFALLNNYIGITTGLKFQFNNYRFDQNITLIEGNDEISYVQETTHEFSKTKLTSTYLLVPVMLEFHIPTEQNNKLHIAVGAEAGIKTGAHTKTVYEEKGDKTKDKNKDDFYLSPFRYNAIAKVGYGDVSVFANYGLTTLFEDGKGPELYPFLIGLAFDF